MRYELATAGEVLAHLVSTKLLANVPWAKLRESLWRTGRSEQLLEFFEELTTIHVTCRLVVAGSSLLKARNGREKRVLDDPTFTADYREYMRESLHIPSEHVDLFYRQAERALRAVSNDITGPESSRHRRQAQARHPHCYMCGVGLNFGPREQAPANESDDDRGERERRNARIYTCEHIWPQAYGGDSVEENYLPSCVSCNTSKKMEFATWAMSGVQSLIFGFSPSESELSRVEGPHRFAMHYYAARQLATKKKITLRDAFLRIGPWIGVRMIDPNDTGDFFNLETHQTDSYFR